RFEPHQIPGPAFPGPLDGGYRGSESEILRQAPPAVGGRPRFDRLRGLRRGYARGRARPRQWYDLPKRRLARRYQNDGNREQLRRHLREHCHFGATDLIAQAHDTSTETRSKKGGLREKCLGCRHLHRCRASHNLRSIRSQSRLDDKYVGGNPMRGLMQDWPLLFHRIIDHAALNHAERPIITRSVEGEIHSTNYAGIRARALRVAQRLERDGIRLGDRVATLAWNTWRHLEAWYGIMGIGAIYHTVNPRLFPEQIAWIVNHAEDHVLMLDLTFVPLVEKLADKLPSIERYVILTDARHMPATTSLKNVVPFEEWISEADGDFVWKTFDENTAA